MPERNAPDICEHDWRVNPHIVLTTNPPQQQHVCSICGATRASGFPKDWKPTSHNPKDWPRVG